MVFFASCMLVQESLDFEPSSSDAMRFIPMQLSTPNPTIRLPDRCYSFALAPAPKSMSFAEARKISDASLTGTAQHHTLRSGTLTALALLCAVRLLRSGGESAPHPREEAWQRGLGTQQRRIQLHEILETPLPIALPPGYALSVSQRVSLPEL